MADWSRIVNTTIRRYVREVEVDVLRNRKIPALLKSKGRITFNWSGDGMDWKIRYKRAPLTGYSDNDTLTFVRRDRWKTANLDYRGYAITDSMTKMERLKNSGVEAIVKIYSELTKNLMEDADDQFGDEFYIDGGGTGNSKRFHGIESFLSTSGASAGNFIALPNDTYADLSCTLGNYGGTWTGTWPRGKGDAQYDFYSPLLVDYTNTGWTPTTKTWANTAVEALRFGIIHTRRNKSKRGMLDYVDMDRELYRQFLAIQDVKERIQVGASQEMVALGFKDTINFDGCDITSEYGIPDGVAYGWNFDQMELRSMQSQLWEVEGPDYDIASKSWRFSIDCFGNLVFRPRYFCKWAAYT